jgi:hypothetical protein
MNFKSWFKSSEQPVKTHWADDPKLRQKVFEKANEIYNKYGGNNRAYVEYSKDSSPSSFSTRKPFEYFHVFILNNKLGEEIKAKSHTNVYLFMDDGELIANVYHAVQFGGKWGTNAKREGMNMDQLDKHLEKYVSK